MMLQVIPIVTACLINHPTTCQEFRGQMITATQCIATTPVLIAGFMQAYPQYTVKKLECKEIEA